ncbi:MAG: hypothetical protein ACJAWS_001195 [Oleiphilaceae bacterium]|jgi:hypothetical protein
MEVKYDFSFDDNKDLSYTVDVDRPGMRNELNKSNTPEWVLLSHCKCSNCPLSEEDSPVCPAAFDIQDVIEDFQSKPASQKVNINVIASDRSYSKRTNVEEGLRSLMGLVLATSQCPILGQLKPMAMHHMPFSSSNEFILRSVSVYLMQQYFEYRAEKTPDWDLKGLISRNKQLQLVNQALWQRIHLDNHNDSNLKTLLSFFSMSSSVSVSLETQLQKLKASLNS